MKVSEVECKTVVEHGRRSQRLVAHTDTGLSGTAEFADGTEPSLSFLSKLLVGRDPFNSEALLADLRNGADGTIPDIALVSAACAAMLDLARQALGVPAHQLMGGRVWDHVRACAAGWAGGATSLDELVAAARRTADAGYTALRVDPFTPLARPATDLDAAVQRVRAVRDAVADEVDLIVAAGRRLDVATALELAARLHDVEPMWIEEPVAASPVEPIREISHRTNVPLAAGRGATPEVLRALIDGNIVNHLVLDVGRAGGPIEARRIAALAEIYHIGVVPAGAGGALSARDALQLAAVLPNLSLVEIRPGVVEVEDGMVALDQDPVATEVVS